VVWLGALTCDVVSISLARLDLVDSWLESRCKGRSALPVPLVSSSLSRNCGCWTLLPRGDLWGVMWARSSSCGLLVGVVSVRGLSFRVERSCMVLARAARTSSISRSQAAAFLVLRLS
jgi:hypothetical protein